MAGQPRVRLTTRKAGTHYVLEHKTLTSAETERNTQTQYWLSNTESKTRNHNRGIRSSTAQIERKSKRSIKRNLARRQHRKHKGAMAPLEPHETLHIKATTEHRQQDTAGPKRLANPQGVQPTPLFIKMKYGTKLKFATPNVQGSIRVAKREKVEYWMDKQKL